MQVKVQVEVQVELQVKVQVEVPAEVEVEEPAEVEVMYLVAPREGQGPVLQDILRRHQALRPPHPPHRLLVLTCRCRCGCKLEGVIFWIQLLTRLRMRLLTTSPYSPMVAEGSHILHRQGYTKQLL